MADYKRTMKEMEKAKKIWRAVMDFCFHLLFMKEGINEMN